LEVTTLRDPKFSTEKFNTQRFDLKKLNNAEVKETYQVKIANSFENLEKLVDNMNINKSLDNIM
jgi:hypothetical protein